MGKKNIYKKIISSFFIILFFSFLLPNFYFKKEVSAENTDIKLLKEKIEKKNNQIKQIEEEIKKYKGNLEKESEKAESLQKELNTLLLNRKTLEAELKKLEINLSKTEINIKKISSEIAGTESIIESTVKALIFILNSIRQIDDSSLVIKSLTPRGLEELGENEIQKEKIADSLKQNTKELRNLKIDLSSKKNQEEENKEIIEKLKKEVSIQHKSVASVVNTTNKLLKDTKNKESEYQKLIELKIKEREAFEKEIFQYESEIKTIIDPSKLPTGNVLSWPLDSVYITQMFGKTVYSQRLYTSGTHNGIDLRALDGTPVKAVLSGVVEGTGNTDTKAGCYSYGKWVLIKHNNGLSSVYGHLSSIEVKTGQKVSTGDVIALSGRTGYVTGPHLHLSILASEGVIVQAIPSSKTKYCSGVVIPIAGAEAYLDPMKYLPKY